MRRRIVASTVLVAVFALITRPSLSQSTANPAPGLDVAVPATALYEQAYRLLINVAVESTGGLRVVAVGPNSPATSMVRSDDHSQIGALELGDVITHLNGTPLDSIEGYYNAMKSSNGDLKLTVTDKRTKQPIEWETKAVKVNVPLEDGDDTLPDDRITHVLLVGQTNDDRLGSAFTKNIETQAAIFRQGIDPAHLDLRIVNAGDCNAQFVVNAVREIGAKSRPQDSIFVFYNGHGGYDPAYAKDDPSGGHFFWMPETGDLMRKVLFENILAQPGRLKILFSDSCNSRGVAEPPQRLFSEERNITVQGPSNLERLLLYHRGYLDINGASQDQFGWGTNNLGTWFALQFEDLIANHTDWRPFLDELAQKSNAFFLEKRRPYLDRECAANDTVCKDIKNQTAMIPAIFRMQLDKDEVPPTGAKRVMRKTVIRLVRSDAK